MVIYDMIPETNMRNMSETTPKDHPIILCEFLVGNKAHTMSSSIQVQVNCSKVRENCWRVSVKLHLCYTVAISTGILLITQTLVWLSAAAAGITVFTVSAINICGVQATACFVVMDCTRT